MTSQLTGPMHLSEQPPQPVAVVRGHVETTEYGEFLRRAYDEVTALLTGAHLSPAGPPISRYRPSGTGLEVEAGFPVDEEVRPAGPVTVVTFPGGWQGTAVHDGEWETIGVTYEALREWLAGNDYVPTDDPWEAYVDAPAAPGPRTVVTWPCRHA